MNILRFLICCSRIGGQQRLTTKQMTTLDRLFGCYSYVCKDKAEFDQLNAQVVAKQNKRFWCDVDVYNTVTGERHKVTDIESLTVTGSTWQERLQLEYHLLRERTGKLNDFILTGTRLASDELNHLLHDQLAAMQTYLRTLKQRMDFCQVPPLVPEVHANVAAHEAESQSTTPPSLPDPVEATPLSQTPGDSQSGGEQSPAESMGTLSHAVEDGSDSGGQSPAGDGATAEPSASPSASVLDFEAELAANGAAPAADVGAGQEPEQVTESAPAEASPASTPPAKTEVRSQKSEVRSEKSKPKKGK